MTTSVRFFLSRAFPEHKDSALEFLACCVAGYIRLV